MRRGKQQGDPPIFDIDFRDRLARLLAWRRDVRRFKPDPVPSPLIDELLGLAALAPSVGNSRGVS
jgi:5,6-dimethylbenzimidazole synthase